MKPYTVIGHHCYFGGFLLGLQAAGWQVKQTRETWIPGGRGARHLGLPVVLGEEEWKPQRADIVVANPPCSRFSVLSQAFYTDEQKNDCGCFKELRELDDTVRAAQPRLFWWETGPMARSSGMDFLHANHRHVRDEVFKGPTTTLILYYDCRFGGFPQRRPRTHILHFRGKIKPPTVSEAFMLQPDHSMGAFFRKNLKGVKLEHAIVPGIYPTKENKDSRSKLCALARKMGGTTPTKFFKWACSPMGIRFDSGRPNIVDDSDRFTPSLLGINYIRRPDDRWMDLAEAAAIMGFPVRDVVRYAQTGVNAGKVQLLLSKGLVPAASQFIAENIVEPVLRRTPLENDGAVRTAQDLGDGVFYYDLTTGDAMKRTTSEATRKLVLMRATEVIEKGDPARFHGTSLRHSKHHKSNQ